MEYSVIDKVACRRAAENLSNGFYFGKSPEGVEFWMKIHDRLAYLGAGKNFNTPVYMDSMMAALMKENERLIKLLEKQEEDMEQQREQIRKLNRKLIAADFINYGR